MTDAYEYVRDLMKNSSGPYTEKEIAELKRLGVIHPDCEIKGTPKKEKKTGLQK